jgi:hypothetical protein
MTQDSLKVTDLEVIAEGFIEKLDPYHRYTSFDYCFNYFQATKGKAKDIEKSCLVLGFYLASWGMYRGSSFMLKKSLKQLEQTVGYIAGLDENIWGIDVEKYKHKDEEKDNIDNIIEVYNGIKEALMPGIDGHAHLTLITKIMLGVFGCVPAYDTNFIETFKGLGFENKCRFSSFDRESLECIHDFYTKNKETIDKLSKNTKTLSFVEDEKTKLVYPKAKIIDMYGFNFSYKDKK